MSTIWRMIGIALSAVSLAATLILTVPAAHAQQRFCGEHKFFLKKLEQQFHEKRSGFGLTADGRLLEMFVGPSGTWTILVTIPGGLTCIVTEGGDWREIDRQPEEPLA